MAEIDALVRQMEGHINAHAPQLALDIWQEAGKPSSREHYFLAGVAYKQLGNNKAAVTALEDSLKKDPDYPLPFYHLAHIAFNDFNYPAAIDWANKYQDYRPYSIDALNWKLFSLKEMGRLAEANEALAQYAKVFPYSKTTLKGALLLAEANDTIGLALLMAGRLPLAQLQKNLFGHALFACWHRLFQITLAQKSLALVYPDTAPAQESDYAEALADLAQICGNFDEAISFYRLARKAGFTEGINYLNETLAHWALGDFHEGHKVYRFRPDSLKRRNYLEDIPEWQGESLKNKTIIVHSEQGSGDVIQFIRYLPAIRAVAGTVLFNTYTDIMSLLRADESTESVSNVTEAVIDTIDYQICMMEMPGYLHQNGIAGLPAEVPYLYPNREKVAYWSRNLSSYQGLKIGLVWAGNPNHVNDANRSASLREWSALGALQGVTWFSLQKGHGASESPYPPAGFNICDLGPEINDFSDTAAILANLDLLISVDTSVAHLAGACNYPCWVLLPSEGKDWRWCTQGETPQWYPSLKLITRPPSDTWDECIRQIVIPKLLELGATISLHSNPPQASTHPLAEEALKNLNTGAPVLALQQAKIGLEEDANNPYLNWLAAQACAALNDAPQALLFLDSVIKTQPRNTDAHMMAHRLAGYRNLAKATKHLEVALKIERKNTSIWREAARFYIENDAPLIAYQIMEQVLSQDQSVENIIVFAISLVRLNNRSAAADLARTLNPEELNDQHLISLFHLYAALDWQKEALALADRIEHAYPNDSYAGLMLGTLMLRWGKFSQGWRLFDQNQWLEPLEAPLSVTDWHGEDLSSKHLLIYQDQGYGDVIQFFALLWKLPPAKKITLSVFAEVLPLLKIQRLPANVTVITHDTLHLTPPSEFDYRAGFMHWVARMAPDLNDAAQYSIDMRLPASRLLSWVTSTRSDPLLKIGIVWAGNPLHQNDFNRSTCLQDWLPLSQIPGCSWYNLQRDSASNQAFECPQFQFKNIVADCKSLLDTASAIMLLDMVITIDSALAHLAAALGKETWVLLPDVRTDYRWQQERSDCPWYPSMRLIRKQPGEEWSDTLDRTASLLQEKVAGTRVG